MSTIQDVMNVLGQISKEVERLPARIKIAANQVTVVTGLSDITKRLGLVTAGEFRTGNDKEPGFGFTGVRIGYPPFSYESQDWNVVGVSNDVLQFGLNASDGKAYFAGGAAIIDANGITLPQATDGIVSNDPSQLKWVDSAGNISTFIQDAYGYGGMSTDSVLYIQKGIPASYATGSHSLVLYLNNDLLGSDAYIRLLGTSTANTIGLVVNGGASISMDTTISMSGNTSISGTIDLDGGTVVNSSQADADFRVYGDNGLVLQLNAGLDRLEIMNLSTTAVHILDGAGTSYFNEPNNDIDIIFEGTTDSNLIYVDAGLDAVGFGGAAESGYKVKVTGDLKLTNIIDFDERASDPSTPSTGDWGLYFKSDGLYYIDDAGATTGPLSTGSASDGTYTPTCTAVANLDAVSGHTTMYIRVGDTVYVTGAINLDPTSSSTNTEARISLPVSSTFSSVYDCIGVVNNHTFDIAGRIIADTTNNEANIKLTSQDTSARDYFFVFSYRVL